MDQLSIEFVEIKLETDLIPPIASPSGTFAITPSMVRPGNDKEVGEMAEFKTTMDKSTFLGAQAIERVEYFWLKDGQLEPGRPLCSGHEAVFGQTAFTCETDFLEDHEGEQTFYAFYRPRLFGVPLPVMFELNNDARATVVVGADAQAEFQGLGLLYILDGFTRTDAHAVSADGRIVVGASTYVSNSQDEVAFRWSDGSIESLGFLNPSSNIDSVALATSDDGSIIVGWSGSETDFGLSSIAVRWFEGNIVSLPTQPGATAGNLSAARGISSDGSIIVGYAKNASGNIQACRWTNGILETFAHLNASIPAGEAQAVSADGTVAVGSALNSSGTDFIAVRWANGGVTPLGNLPGQTWSQALAVSADGSVIVGSSGGHAFRWIAGQMTPLGNGFSVAEGVSGDGNIVVGSYSDFGAFIWDPVHGMRGLQDVLVNEYGLGEELEGWSLYTATSITADGRTIVGSGITGFRQAYRAVLGTPR
jgi:probable HAF family extracellular repeat protein